MKGGRSFSNCHGVHNDVMIKVSCVCLYRSSSTVCVCVWRGGGGGGGGGLVIKVSCVSIGSVVVIS